MKTLNREIMRIGIYLVDEYDLELYNSLILKDSYLIYNKSKNDGGIYITGRIERIKSKTTNKRFEFNLN